MLAFPSISGAQKWMNAMCWNTISVCRGGYLWTRIKSHIHSLCAIRNISNRSFGKRALWENMLVNEQWINASCNRLREAWLFISSCLRFTPDRALAPPSALLSLDCWRLLSFMPQGKQYGQGLPRELGGDCQTLGSVLPLGSALISDLGWLNSSFFDSTSEVKDNENNYFAIIYVVNRYVLCKWNNECPFLR